MGVVREISGFSYYSITCASVSGPSGVAAGPMHCWAICAATGIYLQKHTACSLVSIWPSTGHRVSAGCQLASLTPTASFFHSTICIKSLSLCGTWSFSHSFHTYGFCLGGAGVSADRYRSFFRRFHSIQNIGLASYGALPSGLSAGCCTCEIPCAYTGAHVRGRVAPSSIVSCRLLNDNTPRPIREGL